MTQIPRVNSGSNASWNECSTSSPSFVHFFGFFPLISYSPCFGGKNGCKRPNVIKISRSEEGKWKEASLDLSIPVTAPPIYPLPPCQGFTTHWALGSPFQTYPVPSPSTISGLGSNQDMGYYRSTPSPSVFVLDLTAVCCLQPLPASHARLSRNALDDFRRILVERK